MPILRIEHKVPDYSNWKKAFESDPIDRKRSGVRRYRVFRPVDDPNYVIIDLEFDSREETEAALAALRKLWTNVEGKIMVNPHIRILDITEMKEY